MRRLRICVLVVTALAGLAWVAECGDGATEPAPYFPEPTTVTVSPATAEFTALDATVQLTAEVRDQHGNEIPRAVVAWSSSDVSVASVDGSGLVTAEGNGTATVTAASSEVSGTATVIVAQAIVSLAVEPDGLTAAQAGKQGADTIMVTALDGRGSPVAGASYRWSSDRHSGWVYPAGGVTDALGRLQSTWVAGWPGEGVLSLIVENDSSRVTEEFATLSTTPGNPPNGAVTMLIDHGKQCECGLLHRPDSTDGADGDLLRSDPMGWGVHRVGTRRLPVRRGKARFPSRCKTCPATVAPAGSGQSGSWR